MIKPNELYYYWRADEVAECMDDVPNHLYKTLWNDIVPLQSDAFHELPEAGREALANYWHLLSESDQALLNELDDYWNLHASGEAVCLI